MAAGAIAHVLLVEDNPGDARLLREMLNEQRSPCPRLTLVQTLSEAVEFVGQNAVDMILLDLGLPDAQGLSAIRQVRAVAGHVPLVVLTGLDDESVAGLALQEGAQDYLIKGQIETRGLLRSLRYAVERKTMESALLEEKERAQVTLNCISDAVACTNDSGEITFLNVVAERMTGWSLGSALGRPMDEVFRIVDEPSSRALDLPDPHWVASPDAALPSSSILLRADGSKMPIEASSACIQSRGGLANGAVVIFRDVTAARALALKMSHTAQHDALTGLPNRLLLNDRINQAIARAPRHKNHVAVLFLDLDGFKQINDQRGHATGDRLLQSISERLVACVRGSDTVSRQGGDEFVLLLSEVEQWDDAAITARRILQAISDTHVIDDQEIHITASIGVSVFPDDGADAQILIKHADAAMYEAKERGRQGYRFFKPSLNVRAAERQSIEEALRRALERHEFALHYQAKASLVTGAIIGAEALIRWTHPTLGLITPAHFVPLAEDCGFILPIGNWVLREACAQAQSWMKSGLPLSTVAVNISATEFREKRFFNEVQKILDDSGLDPSCLELELTERVLMEDQALTTSVLARLRNHGVKAVLDDFGTGYSSLSNLRRFAVDALKIDPSLVCQAGLPGREPMIVAAVISMCRSLGLRVVAEGVETLEELSFLSAHQCHEVQGYYLSRPLPAAEFATLLGTGIDVPGFTTLTALPAGKRATSRGVRRQSAR
ncbi:MAG TPA: EAL domain-containing protein [Thermoanaerobaculia bacterium]|nr:EAL domain-containing protein [Thermoanaerobaculia bacterium]